MKRAKLIDCKRKKNTTTTGLCCEKLSTKLNLKTMTMRSANTTVSKSFYILINADELGQASNENEYIYYIIFSFVIYMQALTC